MRSPVQTKRTRYATAFGIHDPYLLRHMFTFLRGNDLVVLLRTCKHVQQAASDDIVWKSPTAALELNETTLYRLVASSSCVRRMVRTVHVVLSGASLAKFNAGLECFILRADIQSLVIYCSALTKLTVAFVFMQEPLAGRYQRVNGFSRMERDTCHPWILSKLQPFAHVHCRFAEYDFRCRDGPSMNLFDVIRIRNEGEQKACASDDDDDWSDDDWSDDDDAADHARKTTISEEEQQGCASDDDWSGNVDSEQPLLIAAVRDGSGLDLSSANRWRGCSRVANVDGVLASVIPMYHDARKGRS